MALLIDGYNLMHVAGIVGRGVGPGGLERSRLALLNFLAESLEPARFRERSWCSTPPTRRRACRGRSSTAG